ncbi:MAG TPA: alpha/beta hydrolase [Solirubrobacteraceae bacterium]|nr:alpha/beta hydrolase [Solirubrobacteraceae bacterium]
MDEHTIQVAGAEVFYRRRPSTADHQVLYLHSVPTSSDDWRELLSLTGGIAPDLPGFGRSGKGGHLDYSLDGYVRFVDELLTALAPGPVTIVGHGWGATIGLVFAQRHPEWVQRLVAIDAVPPLPGFRWPRIARWWRRPGIGELLMGSATRWMLARLLRRGAAAATAWPDRRVDEVWDQFDQGTQRAILRLHRSVDEHSLGVAGEHLDTLHQPALVVWGERDPWLEPAFADALGRRLPAATVLRVPDAGHWPWLERPELARRIAAFASGEQAA